MSKFSGVEFLVNREVKDRIIAMREDELPDYADSSCDKCYGLGRSAYKVHPSGKKEIIVCKCVIRKVKKSIIEEGIVDAAGSKRRDG